MKQITSNDPGIKLLTKRSFLFQVLYFLILADTCWNVKKLCMICYNELRSQFELHDQTLFLTLTILGMGKMWRRKTRREASDAE